MFYTNDVRTNPSAGEWLEFSMGAGRANDFVSALSASIEPEGVLYFGTRNGKIFKVADVTSGESPLEVTGANMPSGTITSLSVDPNNADKVLATFGNYEVLSIWLTEDGGQNWVSVSGNLEENNDGSGNGPSVRYVEMLPNGDNPIYFVGTSLGLYKTELLDGDNTIWTQESTDLIGSSVVSMIKSRPVEGQIVVGTHGNGVFQASYDVAFTPNINYSIDFALQQATLRGPVSFTSGAGFVYQWIKDDQEIAGATDSEFVTTEPGAYKLRVTDELGPVAVSNTINLKFDKTGPSISAISKVKPYSRICRSRRK